MRYSAFISYNHRDEAHARWLHRAIETWRVPPRLRGQQGRDGNRIGARLKPVFRDRDEVTPAADLAGVVRAALADSESLIVICSPDGARSKWVNAEIRQYAALGRRNRIFCIIVGGEPMAGDPARECLPPALFEDGAGEPLCADIRPRRDSRDEARMKLLAAIVGVAYDEVRRREHARRVRQLTFISGGAIAGLVVTGALAISAYLARNEAVRQRDIARERSITAERTVEFVKGMFAVADPSEARGSSITAREVLDRGERDYALALRDEPVVKAEIGLTLAEVYGALGLYRQSDQLVRANAGLPPTAQAVRARQAMLQAESQFRLGEYADALTGFERAVALARADDNARETVLWRALVGQGQTLSALDRFAESERVLREAIAIVAARGTAGQRDHAFALEALGQNAYYAGEYGAARASLERAMAMRLAAEGGNSPSVSDDLGTLASIAYLEGDGTKAEALFRSRLAIDERVLGREHPDVATTLNNIGRILVERRAFAEAEPLLDRAAAISLRERGALHDDMAFTLANLALARYGLGRVEQAQELLQRARVAAEANHHRMLAPILTDLAALACAQGRSSEGLSLLDAARPTMSADYPDDAWRMAWMDSVLAECRWLGGEHEAARALLAAASVPLARRWAPDTLFGAELQRRRELMGLR